MLGGVRSFKKAVDVKRSLTAFSGCMASGKSALLLNRVAYLRSLGKDVSVYLHITSHRDRLYAVSRAGKQEYALRFRKPDDLLRFPTNEVLAIDEAQDLNLAYTSTLLSLIDRGVVVIAAGRDTDFRGEPYPIMDWMREHATEYQCLTAVCTVCLGTAKRSQRLVRGEPAPADSPIHERGLPEESYEPRCLEHHIVPGL